MSVGFRPLLESSSLVSSFQAIPQGPCPHTRAAKDHPTCQPWLNSFLPNKRVCANIGISGMCESSPLTSWASGNTGQTLGFPWHSPLGWQEVTHNPG